MPLRHTLSYFLIAAPLYAQGIVPANGRGGGPVGMPGAQAAPPAMDCAASGTVVNAITGEPIPRAMVTMGAALGIGAAVGAATDANGKWTIANTACGLRVPTAARPGFLPAN